MTPEEAQLWCFFYEDAWAADASIAAAYDALITPEERQRVQAFRFEKHQRQCLAARALLRTVLSHHAPVAPADWRFGTGRNGKPFIASPAEHQTLHFNLAHTQDLVVCAVSRGHARLGVDVEALGRGASAAEIANSHFSPDENTLLKRVPAEHHHHAFIRLWTLKESFIKATGDGLSTPLNQFGFEIDAAPVQGPGSVPVQFHAPLQEQAAQWRFVQWALHGQFAVALGADTGGAPLHCRVFDTVPLRGHAEVAGGAFTTE